MLGKWKSRGPDCNFCRILKGPSISEGIFMLFTIQADETRVGLLFIFFSLVVFFVVVLVFKRVYNNNL